MEATYFQGPSIKTALQLMPLPRQNDAIIGSAILVLATAGQLKRKPELEADWISYLKRTYGSAWTKELRTAVVELWLSSETTLREELLNRAKALAPDAAGTIIVFR